MVEINVVGNCNELSVVGANTLALRSVAGATFSLFLDAHFSF